MNVVENSQRRAGEAGGAGDAAADTNPASDATDAGVTARGMRLGVSMVVGVGCVVGEKAGNSSNLGVANSAVANQLVFAREFFSAILKREEKRKEK